jgi:hypothetical protein
MIAAFRNKFNALFSDQMYQQMIMDLEGDFLNSITFRLAETPVFIDKITKQKLLAAGNEICDFITGPSFKEITEKSFKQVLTPGGASPLPDCMVLDFAICKNESGEIFPKLIELQGFPSLFAFEYYHHQAFSKNFEIPQGFSPFLNGYNETDYIAHLSKIIKGNQNKHTVLLELFPHEQKTKIDFYKTKQLLDIPIVCLSEIFVEGNNLFYTKDGIVQKIERLYNRIVWDELAHQSASIQSKGKLLLEDLNIEWVTHPNHFYSISKFLLPFLKSTSVPHAQFLTDPIPSDLENYVLKPLFSYAGNGVIMDVKSEDLKAIHDPANWILQQKVCYAPIIETPTGPAITEIRLFYFLDPVTNKYIATGNLARLSKGKMIGVGFNTATNWIGGSLAYFEI